MNKKVMVGIATAASVLLAGGVALAAPRGATSQNTVSAIKSQTALMTANESIVSAAGAATLRGGSSVQAVAVPRSALIRGWVVSVSGNAIRLDLNGAGARVRDVNVATTISTTYYVPGVSDPTINDIKVDDYVAMLVQRTAPARAITAKAVAVLPAPNQMLVAGKVTRLSSDKFTLANANGKSRWTIAISAETKVIVPGHPNAGASSLKNDNLVLIYGRPEGPDSLDALLIVVRPLNNTNTSGGLVVSVSGNTIMMWTPAGVQLSVDASNAVFFAPGIPNASISNVHTGQMIIVIGSRSGNSVTAQLITNAPIARIQAAKARAKRKPHTKSRTNTSGNGPSV